MAALHCCICAILHKVQEMSSTGVHGSSLLIADEQVQNVTQAVKEILTPFTVVTVADGEHALKELHHTIIDAVHAELLWRICSESNLNQAVKAQSQLLTGSLAVSIVRAIKNADTKDLYLSASVQPGSSPSIKEEPLVSSQIFDNALLASQVSSRGFPAVLLTQRHKKAGLTLAKMYVSEPKLLLGNRIEDRWDQERDFG